MYHCTPLTLLRSEFFVKTSGDTKGSYNLLHICSRTPKRLETCWGVKSLEFLVKMILREVGRDVHAHVRRLSAVLDESHLTADVQFCWVGLSGRFIDSISLNISRPPVKCSDSQMTPDCESVHHNFIITTCYFCDMAAAVSCWLLKLIRFYWRRIFWAMNPTDVSPDLNIVLIWMRFGLRSWRLWTLLGCLGWHASSVRHGGL